MCSLSLDLYAMYMYMCIYMYYIYICIFNGMRYVHVCVHMLLEHTRNILSKMIEVATLSTHSHVLIDDKY